MNVFKKIFLLSILFYGVIGCSDDILDQPPKDQVELDEFFKSASDLEIATNDLFSILPGKEVYIDDSESDNILPITVKDRVKGTRLVPTEKGAGGWSWDELRRINFILENYKRVDDEKAKAKYSGITRFYRAFFYFDKVKRFGDVPWYNKVLDVDDDKNLYKARDSRELIMDSIFADIDYAIQNIPAEKQLTQITKYTALALKARIGLYEGTYRKYHELGPYESFLEAAIEAADELIESGAYSLVMGDKNTVYRNLFSRENQDDQESILAAKYTASDRRHDIAYRLTAPTQGAFGLTKDLINSYLMTDGSRFTDQPGYQTMDFYDEMQNRDPRLTQTTAGPDFVVTGEEKREPVDLSITTTGYRVIKALPTRDQWGSGASTNDIILFRYAETLLIYAEAKAELGTITQDDLDRSVNKLRDRVGMPPMDLAAANAHPDPYQESLYPNVNQGANKGIILEIRRERRIEMVNEGLRWEDLMRWKEGKKLEQPMVGIYFPRLGAFDFNNDGIPDVYIYNGDDSDAPKEVSSKARINIQETPLYNPTTGEQGGTSGNLDPFPERGHFDEEKDYLYPIPLQDLRLNENLEQNPGWER